MSPKQFFERLTARGEFFIREAQFDLATGQPVAKGHKLPSASMLRWMGMQYLGQSPAVNELNKPKDPAEKARSGGNGFAFQTPDGKKTILPYAPGTPLPEAAAAANPEQKDEGSVGHLIKEEERAKAEEPAGVVQEPGIIVVSAHEVAE